MFLGLGRITFSNGFMNKMVAKQITKNPSNSDRFQSCPHGRRRPGGAAGVVGRVARPQIPLSILVICFRGGGEKLRPADATSSWKCTKFVWIFCHALFLVLFAVELHTYYVAETRPAPKRRGEPSL